MQLNHRNKKQIGLSLVELLVGVAVALIIITGAGASFLAHNLSVSTNLRADKLNHDIQMISDIISNELKRASYWNSSAAGANTTNPNPFRVITVTANCVLYSYDDRNAAGDNTPDGIIQDFERMGFRLNTNNNSIEIKTAGDIASEANCATGTWAAITDPNSISINTLNFALTARCVNANTSVVTNAACTNASGASGERTIEIRGITTAIAGAVTADGSQKRLDSFARIRNNAMVTY